MFCLGSKYKPWCRVHLNGWLLLQNTGLVKTRVGASRKNADVHL